jgi:superoxide reductase
MQKQGREFSPLERYALCLILRRVVKIQSEQRNRFIFSERIRESDFIGSMTAFSPFQRSRRMSVFICQVCGHISFNQQSQFCPVCKSPQEKSLRNDHIFEESAEKSREASIKHIPVLTVNRKCGLIPEQSCADVIVRVGATLHPMEPAHFIQFIDCYADDRYVARLFLTPGTNPAGCFHLKSPGSKITIVENCTIHGYWKTEEHV